MDNELQRKIARNETLFREANEAIERGLRPAQEHDAIRFRCECARLDCNQGVRLTRRQYEHVRAHGRWFAVLRGHEIPEAERVVESHPEYVVVEKRGTGAAVADATDPRGG